MPFPYEEFDLSHVRTYPLAGTGQQGPRRRFRATDAAGRELRELVRVAAGHSRRRRRAARGGRSGHGRRAGRGIVWGIGAHVIKTGVSPVLIDLMQRGYVSALAMNGAGVIHDFEVALAGATSEDVDEALGPGRFGMAQETGSQLNAVAERASAGGQGFGQAVARFLSDAQPAHADKSIAVAAHRLGIPLTVHVAMGTDITHMHPQASGAAIGDTSLRDFRYFTSSVARLDDGVYLNCGSAVVLPEIFLKAVALARNRGIALDGLTTVNIDFQRLYRPMTNVVTRPVAGTRGVGISLIGHHEILIPLIAAAVLERERLQK